VLCLGSSANIVGASVFRSRGRFFASMTLTQGHNLVLVFAALAAIGASIDAAYFPLTIIALAYVLSALIGWVGAFRLQPLDNALDTGKLPWKEGRTILATGIAVIVLIQLESLTIPKLLDYESLATFAILASIAGSPYRVLQMGVNFTLLPRLRRAPDIVARREIIKSEAMVAALIVSIASVLVWLFSSLIVEWFLEGRYKLSDGLVAAAILAGIAKVVSSFTCTGVTALGDSNDLSRLNIYSWIAVAVGTAGAILGANSGLTGVVLGISAGWTFLAGVAVTISMPYFRLDNT
jgi:O-antigen/teichoic acid export membrane protein